MRTHLRARGSGFWMLAVLAVTLALAPAAHAGIPTGACCFANGSCQDQTAEQCEARNADFIGEATSCDHVSCAAPLAAPMLSIVGVVALLGALAGFGVYRLTFGRRAAS